MLEFFLGSIGAIVRVYKKKSRQLTWCCFPLFFVKHLLGNIYLACCFLDFLLANPRPKSGPGLFWSSFCMEGIFRKLFLRGFCMIGEPLLPLFLIPLLRKLFLIPLFLQEWRRGFFGEPLLIVLPAFWERFDLFLLFRSWFLEETALDFFCSRCLGKSGKSKFMFLLEVFLF